MCNTANDAYLESRVLSADPVELVRLLYQGAIGAISDARRFLAAGQIAERSRAISKASAIVIELSASLDSASGGEISSRLAALYEYLLHRLLEANLQQSDAALAEVLSLLMTLSEGWAGVHQQAAEPGPAETNRWTPPEPAAACASQSWSF